METISIKLLAEKVLQRNRQINIKETPSFHIGKLAAENFPLPEVRGDIPSEPDQISLSSAFRTLFEQAFAELEVAYLPGTLELIREEYPKLEAEILEAQDHINELWLKTREGMGNLRDFQDAVERWQTLHLKAIDLAHTILETPNEKI